MTPNRTPPTLLVIALAVAGLVGLAAPVSADAEDASSWGLVSDGTFFWSAVGPLQGEIQTLVPDDAGGGSNTWSLFAARTVLFVSDQPYATETTYVGPWTLEIPGQCQTTTGGGIELPKVHLGVWDGDDFTIVTTTSPDPVGQGTCDPVIALLPPGPFTLQPGESLALEIFNGGGAAVRTIDFTGSSLTPPPRAGDGPDDPCDLAPQLPICDPDCDENPDDPRCDETVECVIENVGPGVVDCLPLPPAPSGDGFYVQYDLPALLTPDPDGSVTVAGTAFVFDPTSGEYDPAGAGDVVVWLQRDCGIFNDLPGTSDACDEFGYGEDAGFIQAVGGGTADGGGAFAVTIPADEVAKLTQDHDDPIVFLNIFTQHSAVGSGSASSHNGGSQALWSAGLEAEADALADASFTPVPFAAGVDLPSGDGFVAHIEPSGPVLTSEGGESFTVTVYLNDGSGFAAADEGTFTLVLKDDCGALSMLSDELDCLPEDDTTSAPLYPFTASASGVTIDVPQEDLEALLRGKPLTGLHIWVQRPGGGQSNYALPTDLALQAGGAEATATVDLVDEQLWHPVPLLGPVADGECDEGEIGVEPACVDEPEMCGPGELGVEPVCVPIPSGLPLPEGDGFVAHIVPRNALRGPTGAIVESDLRNNYAFDVCAYDAEGDPYLFTDWRLELWGIPDDPTSDDPFTVFAIGTYGPRDMEGEVNAGLHQDGTHCQLVIFPKSVRGTDLVDQLFMVAFWVPFEETGKVAVYSEPVNALIAQGEFAAADTLDEARASGVYLVDRRASPVGTGDFSAEALVDDPVDYGMRLFLHAAGLL